MDERIVRERIAEMADALSAITRQSKDSASMGTYTPKTLHKSAQDIGEMLDQIRLVIKYLMFDIEATRRENSYLREMLESRWNRGESSENT